MFVFIQKFFADLRRSLTDAQISMNR